MGNNEERLSEDEARSCQRIEEALELYETGNEAEYNRGIDSLTEEECDALEERIDESRNTDFVIDETEEAAKQNWKQAMYEEEHDMGVPLSDIYILISKYKK